MKRGRRTDATLEDAVDFYFELAEATGGLEARVPAEEWLELSHYDFVAQPREALTSLCRFMGVDPEPAYLESCAQLVYPRPRRTRETAPWTPRLVDQVRRRSREYPFLARYAEEECAHADVGA